MAEPEKGLEEKADTAATQEEPGVLQSGGGKEPDMTERLSKGQVSSHQTASL